MRPISSRPPRPPIVSPRQTTVGLGIIEPGAFRSRHPPPDRGLRSACQREVHAGQDAGAYQAPRVGLGVGAQPLFRNVPAALSPRGHSGTASTSPASSASIFGREGPAVRHLSPPRSGRTRWTVRTRRGDRKNGRHGAGWGDGKERGLETEERSGLVEDGREALRTDKGAFCEHIVQPGTQFRIVTGPFLLYHSFHPFHRIWEVLTSQAVVLLRDDASVVGPCRGTMRLPLPLLQLNRNS